MCCSLKLSSTSLATIKCHYVDNSVQLRYFHTAFTDRSACLRDYGASRRGVAIRLYVEYIHVFLACGRCVWSVGVMLSRWPRVNGLYHLPSGTPDQLSLFNEFNKLLANLWNSKLDRTQSLACVCLCRAFFVSLLCTLQILTSKFNENVVSFDGRRWLRSSVINLYLKSNGEWQIRSVSTHRKVVCFDSTVVLSSSRL